MSQAIAGVVPATEREATVMTTWPTLGAFGVGRWWGRRFANKLGITLFGIPFTLGRLMALVSIPFILPPYFLTLLPGSPLCLRYRLTNRRVIVERPYTGAEEQSVSLDRFDSIELDVLPGQEWYPAGDLVFKNGEIETFRLSGVPNPKPFRHTCLKSRQAFVGVQKAREMGAAV
ncbi:PH domain-containing protein [Adhaeretor mobilis]|uniref:DUF304 domain-containing protein n=1 Tax=Adhaeretor mobilis TaxID=1930276 RepID=A0A517MV24_9BACT|nr:PH domain-containing protein [Adhaeretor mobilis]QDS98731.1 hypothetical protein HG15A2_20140 [Adhaeretor mobilis]